MGRTVLDYRSRPAKSIERHLLVDVCRALLHRYPTHEFEYVGMGALEFIDFALFHRALGIRSMISIESQEKSRHDFNRPFSGITVVQGHSTELLGGPKIPLTNHSLVWLDYMGAVDQKMVLADIQQFCRTAPAPSALFVTVQCVPERLGDRYQALEARVGADRIPNWVDDDNLATDGLGRAQRDIIGATITSAIRERTEPAHWEQAVNIQYRDGARMQTVGGFLLPNDVDEEAAGEMMSGLDFARREDDYLDLRVPVVTARERLALDAQLPLKPAATLSLENIPKNDLAAYERIYRYMHLAGLQSAYETTYTA